jgi:hypothetical protein
MRSSPPIERDPGVSNILRRIEARSDASDPGSVLRVQDLMTEGPLTTGVLDHDSHQGLHGENLVRSLVVAAGLEISRPDPAYGKDFYIGFPGPRETLRSPRILVSVKSWRDPVLSAENQWKYNLRASNYNFLANSRDLRPYLFLAIVPPTVDLYSVATHDELMLRMAVYWHSFDDVEPVASGGSSTRLVEVSKENLLTADTLTSLVKGDDGAAKVPL